MWYVALVLPSLLTYFDPPPTSEELPARMPSPFATKPHALARRAAGIVASEIHAGEHGFSHDFDRAGDGKMFGVLVVMAQDGRVGFVRAVSGMLGGQWLAPGFAPPLFDLADRESFWPAGQDRLAEIEGELTALLQSDRAQKLREDAAEVATRHARSQEALRLRHQRERALRAQTRERLQNAGGDNSDALQKLAEESRAGRREGKVLRKEQLYEQESIDARTQALEEDRLTLKRERTRVSNELLVKIQDGYQLVNARGEMASLASLFAPQEPPGGS